MTKNKILVVDDEQNISEVITEFLTNENYEVRTASNGYEALKVLDNWIPDLIVSDIMMPVMDGNQFHETVRDNKTLCFIPFIFLTAKKEYNIERRSLLSGADDFLSKPFKLKTLKRIIDVRIENFNRIKNNYNVFDVSKNPTILHEINTPLYSILEYINLLIENGENFKKEETQSFYEAIKKSGDRLNRTLKNLILFQKLKNNVFDFSDQTGSNPLETFLKVKQEICKTNEVDETSINFSIDECNLQISAENLEIIFIELLDNGLKFSLEDQTIEVSGKQFNESYYELVIQDFGMGFSQDELRKIDATTQFNRDKNEQQGLGLGLYIVKAIVKKTGGTFSIVSKEGEGTTIKLFFPIQN